MKNFKFSKPILRVHFDPVRKGWYSSFNLVPAFIAPENPSYSLGRAICSAEEKRAFTLAEVLITLAIIGVVAAMTIPTLLAKINDIVATNQTKVFKAKLIKGLNLTKTAGDLNDTYTSTYDFLVNGLGKNLKMVKVCDSDHIRDCMPYVKIVYDRGDDKEYSINVEDITTSDKLNLQASNGFEDVAAFVLADGTPVLVSYNKQCIDDPDKADTTINSCLAGIYDLNGTRKPNKMGKDLSNFNGASIRGMVLATLNGVKIVSTAAVPTPIKTSDLCDTSDSISVNWTVKSEYTKYGITKCYYDANADDYWAGAMIACQDMGAKLPDEQQLADIANALYGGTQGGGSFSASDSQYNFIFGAGSIGSGETIPTALSGIGSSWYNLWSSSEDSVSEAYVRYFGSTYTNRYGGGRTGFDIMAVCVAK